MGFNEQFNEHAVYSYLLLKGHCKGFKPFWLLTFPVIVWLFPGFLNILSSMVRNDRLVFKLFSWQNARNISGSISDWSLLCNCNYFALAVFIFQIVYNLQAVNLRYIWVFTFSHFFNLSTVYYTIHNTIQYKYCVLYNVKQHWNHNCITLFY